MQTWSPLLFRMKAVIFIHVLYLILCKTLTVKGVSKCESKIELRTVLLACPVKDTGCDDEDPLSQAMNPEEGNSGRNMKKNEMLREESDKAFPNAVKDCKRKLIITLKIKSSGKIPCGDEFILIDHVFDPLTNKKGRLLSPIVLKLRQEQMIQLYGLRFEKVINSDPYEEQKETTKPCSSSLKDPPCGITTYDGTPIPFSEGFCCSRDPLANENRHLHPESLKDSFPLHNSKLVTPDSGLSNQGKESWNAIIKPELVKLNSNHEDGGNLARVYCDNDEHKPIKQLSPEIPPNLLMENDRKIMCKKNDFIEDLSKLQNERNGDDPQKDSTTPPNGFNHENNNNAMAGENQAYFPSMGSGKPNGSFVEQRTLNNDFLNDLLGVLRMTETSSESSLEKKLSNLYGQMSRNQMGRGKRQKREDRFFTKPRDEFSIEETLDKFAKSKNFESNRRKRLLELSHKRFRKSEIRCRDTGGWNECSNGCGENANQPPKFFFCHDKVLLSSPELSKSIQNASCKSSNCLDYSDSSQEEYTNAKGKKTDSMIDIEGFAKGHQRLQKTDGKFQKGNVLGKLNSKQDRVTHNNGGNIENNIWKNKEKLQMSQTMSREGEISPKDEEYTKTKEQKIKMSDLDRNDEDAEYKNKNMESWKFQKSPFDSKNLKNIQIERERNYFLGNNKEKFGSVAVKSYKKQEGPPVEDTELKDKKFFEQFEEKTKEHHKNEDQVEEQTARSFEEKLREKSKMTLLETEKQQENEKEKLKSETLKPYDQSFLDTMEYLMKQTKLPDKYKVLPENSKKLESPSPEINARKYKPKSSMRNVDFKVQIIRNLIPDAIKSWPEASQGFNEYLKAKNSDTTNLYKFKPYTNLGSDLPMQRPLSHHRLKFYPSPALKVAPQYAVDYRGRQEYEPNVHLGKGFQNTLEGIKIPQSYLENKEKEKISQADLSRILELVRKNEKERFQNTHPVYYVNKLNKHYYKPSYTGRSSFQDSQMRGNAHEYKNNLMHSDKSYPETRRFHKYERVLSDNRFYPQDQLYEDLEDSKREKTRIRRTLRFSFEPAVEFFRSELESSEDEGFAPHKNSQILQNLPKRKIRNSQKTDNITDTVRDSSLTSLEQGETENGFGDYSPAKFIEGESVSKMENGKVEGKVPRKSDRERLIQSYLNAPEYILEKMKPEYKGKREVTDNSEAKGNSTCENYTTTAHSQQGTAHCMRFGDLWYSVYRIQKPVIAQLVGVQMFEKRASSDGNFQWRDLTKGKMIRIGSFLPKAEDELPTISLSFFGAKTNKIEMAIDPDNYLLMIPTHLTDPSKSNAYPQLEGGPAEYLVIPRKDISTGGDCNMIGSSFEAFAHQPDRCSQPKGCCLSRRPVDLWREDMEARVRGKRGQYFVENFGTVSNSPIKTYTNFSGEYLGLEYYGEYSSTIQIEIKADYNTIVRKGSNAQIPSVFIDSTYPKKTRIILSVLNNGLISSYFRPRLADCPPDLDPAWCPLEGPLVTIPPQHKHDFKLDLSGVLPTSKVAASVQVLDELNRKVASRKILIKRGERCVCAFHCKCNCIGKIEGGRVCHKLSQSEYRAAGYRGPFPFRLLDQKSATDNVLRNIHVVFITAAYVLLLFGAFKAFVGIFFRRLGIAGTRIIVGPRRIRHYYECELQNCTVLFNDCGFPVHPTTCLPVQIVPLWFEIILNIFFFYLYPLRGIWFLLPLLPCCKMFCSECEGCCRQDEGWSYDQKSSSPLLEKYDQTTCMNYNLTTLIDKKSKTEEFPSYLPYKGDEDPLEEDDTEFILQEMKRYRKK